MHEVREVIKGERIVCVGWIESYIKRDDERKYFLTLESQWGTPITSLKAREYLNLILFTKNSRNTLEIDKLKMAQADEKRNTYKLHEESCNYSIFGTWHENILCVFLRIAID